MNSNSAIKLDEIWSVPHLKRRQAQVQCSARLPAATQHNVINIANSDFIRFNRNLSKSFDLQINTNESSSNHPGASERYVDWSWKTLYSKLTQKVTSSNLYFVTTLNNKYHYDKVLFTVIEFYPQT